jgi:hypothetical protein
LHFCNVKNRLSSKNAIPSFGEVSPVSRNKKKREKGVVHEM